MRQSRFPQVRWQVLKPHLEHRSSVAESGDQKGQCEGTMSMGPGGLRVCLGKQPGWEPDGGVGMRLRDISAVSSIMSVNLTDLDNEAMVFIYFLLQPPFFCFT